SEAEAHAQTNLPFDVRGVGQRGAARNARDLTEGGRRGIRRRVGEHRDVEDVAGFDSRFEPLRTAHRERAEHRQVEVLAARPVELVAKRVAEADAGWLSERGGVEPGTFSADLVRRGEVADEVRDLLVARRVQGCAIRVDPERV